MEDVLRNVSGEWNGYRFKFVERSEFSTIISHLQENFYQDEPMHKILGVTPERRADMDQKILDVLNLEHESFYAFPVDQPEKIAAVLILWCHEKGAELPYFEDRSPLTALVRKTISQLKRQYDIHEQRGVDVYPELFIISTDREHRGKGLATEMYRRAIAKLKSQGHKLASSTFSNPLSRKIGENLGFEPVSRLELNDVRKEDGSLVFEQGGEHHFIVETILDL